MQDVITRRWGSGKEHVWIIEIRKKNQIKRRITSTDEWCESVVFDSDETGQPPKQPPTIRHRFGIAAAAADDARQKRLEKFTLIATQDRNAHWWLPIISWLVIHGKRNKPIDIACDFRAEFEKSVEPLPF
jgi:hypothetical protein